MVLDSAKSVFVLEFLLNGTFRVLELSHVNSECFILGTFLSFAFSIGEEYFHKLMVIDVVIVLKAFEFEL
jgi:hypothetical protein